MQNTPMETPMETSMQEGIRFDLMELTQILFQHWIWIAATTVLCAAAGLLFTIFGMTPQYQALLQRKQHDRKGSKRLPPRPSRRDHLRV